MICLRFYELILEKKTENLDRWTDVIKINKKVIDDIYDGCVFE